MTIHPSKKRGIEQMPDTVFRVRDDEKFDLSISLADRVGNVLGALPDGATCTWTSSDPTIVSVTQSGTDPAGATVETVGPLGTAQVSVVVQLPGGGATLNGMMNLEVVAGDASTLKLNAANVQPRTIS